MSYDVTPAELFDQLKLEQIEHHKSKARTAELESKLANCDELLIHYGFDSGSVAERIDRICAGLIDAVVIARDKLELESKLAAAEKQYISAVTGRKEFRLALKKSRKRIAELEHELANHKDTIGLFKSWMKRHDAACVPSKTVWELICKDYPYLREE